MVINRLALSLCCLFCYLISGSSLKAEIQEIKISWTASLCVGGCDALLATEFHKVQGVTNVDINGPAGLATLKWSPDVPFSFYPINQAMRNVGPRLRAISLKVRGKIKREQNSYKIISEGDRTEIYLLNPITPVPNQYVETHNSFNRQLSPDLQRQLSEAESKNQTVVIFGPLFQLFSSPPLQMILEQISVETSK